MASGRYHTPLSPSPNLGGLVCVFRNGAGRTSTPLYSPVLRCVALAWLADCHAAMCTSGHHWLAAWASGGYHSICRGNGNGSKWKTGASGKRGFHTVGFTMTRMDIWIGSSGAGVFFFLPFLFSGCFVILFYSISLGLDRIGQTDGNNQQNTSSDFPHLLPLFLVVVVVYGDGGGQKPQFLHTPN